MVILMDQSKALRITSGYRPIHKFETGMDNLDFLIPQTYGNTDLKNFAAVALVTLDNGLAKKGLFKYLTYEEDLYKERLKVSIPITTALTKEPYDVKIWLMFIKKNQENTSLADGVLETSSIGFSIAETESIASTSTESFDEVWLHTAIDEVQQKVDDLKDKVDAKADGITIDENNNLVLASGDEVLAQVKLNDDVTWGEWK